MASFRCNTFPVGRSDHRDCYKKIHFAHALIWAWPLIRRRNWKLDQTARQRVAVSANSRYSPSHRRFRGDPAHRGITIARDRAHRCPWCAFFRRPISQRCTRQRSDTCRFGARVHGKTRDRSSDNETGSERRDAQSFARERRDVLRHGSMASSLFSSSRPLSPVNSPWNFITYSSSPLIFHANFATTEIL